MYFGSGDRVEFNLKKLGGKVDGRWQGDGWDHQRETHITNDLHKRLEVQTNNYACNSTRFMQTIFSISQHTPISPTTRLKYPGNILYQEYMKTRVCSLGPFLLWVSITAEFRDYIIFGADLRREMA